MPEFVDVTDMSEEQRDDALFLAIDAIREGQVVVLPTDTVYGVAADAFNPDAVAALLAAKGRGREMPPPVLIPNLRTVEGLACDIPDDARQLMSSFWPGGLTLIVWAQATLHWDLGETAGTVALRMPDQPLALDLLARTGPLAVSSANRSGQLAATTARDAREQLGNAVAVYLDAGELPPSEASTIVDCTGPALQVVRQGVITVERLRAVAPQLLDIDGNPPAAEVHDRAEPATVRDEPAGDGDSDPTWPREPGGTEPQPPPLPDTMGQPNASGSDGTSP